MKKKNALLFLALIALGLFSPMIAKSDILGGWEEDKGSFISNSFSSNTMNMRANPRHAGRAETTKAGGNSYKRARGWTTWPRTRHYTVARLEDLGRINGTSGRVWGVGGTEAISPWRAFTRDNGSPGTAKTYYGR